MITSRPVPETIKARRAATVHGVIARSSSCWSFELGWNETSNLGVRSCVDEVDLRISRHGRDDEIDSSKSEAKLCLAVIVHRNDLIIESFQVWLSLQTESATTTIANSTLRTYVS